MSCKCCQNTGQDVLCFQCPTIETIYEYLVMKLIELHVCKSIETRVVISTFYFLKDIYHILLFSKMLGVLSQCPENLRYSPDCCPVKPRKISACLYRDTFAGAKSLSMIIITSGKLLELSLFMSRLRRCPNLALNLIY